VAVTGPDFISLQVRDLERSAAFYEQYLGLKRSRRGTAARRRVRHQADRVRRPRRRRGRRPGRDRSAGAREWRCGCTPPTRRNIHDALAAAGTTIISAPVDGPFGRTFTFADPDGYQVTLHDRG